MIIISTYAAVFLYHVAEKLPFLRFGQVIEAVRQNARFDLVLLDISLSDGSGYTVCKAVKADYHIPVIFLTASGDEYSTVAGFDLGADDYIPKPFEIEELLARINALLRRVNFSKKSEEELSYKKVSLDVDRMGCIIRGDSDGAEQTEIQLSKTEFLLLKFLLENQGKVFSRQQIIDEIWGAGHFIDENTVDVYVGYLRSKISEYDKSEYIRTVRGVGYILG